MEAEKCFNNIVVIDYYRDLEDIYGVKNGLIIIDMADTLLKKRADIAEYINTDMNNNTYLIFARGQIGVAYSPNYAVEFIREGKQISIKYIFNVKGWF